MREELLGDGEADRRPNHPLITQAAVPGVELPLVDAAPGALGAKEMRTLALGTPVVDEVSPQ